MGHQEKPDEVEPATVHRITGDDGALAAFATFSHAECMRLLQGLLDDDQVPSAAVYMEVSVVLLRREENGQEQEQPSAAAAAVAGGCWDLWTY